MATNFRLLILLLSEPLFCGELFWFSYKIVTANSVAIYEEKNIAPVTIPYEGKNQYLCTLPLQKKEKESTTRFLNRHFDEILPCFYANKAHINSWNEHRLKQANDRIEVILEPIRFTVEFKDDCVTINAVR